MNIGQEVYIRLDTHRETIHGAALKTDGEIICSIDFPNNPEALIISEIYKIYKNQGWEVEYKEHADGEYLTFSPIV